MILDYLKYSAGVGTVWAIIGFLLWLMVPVKDTVVLFMLIPITILVVIQVIAFFRYVRTTLGSFKAW